jgi:phosphogluconate dehydratase
MPLHPVVDEVTDRIRARSAKRRAAYLAAMQSARKQGPNRGHLGCSNQAHAYAATGPDQGALATGHAPHLGIISAYNDMLSAHRPYETYPELIRQAARDIGATAQVAGGVPAMCDGVTQGEAGMELSLFSRDVIALAAAVALSHNTFDAAVFLGVCDKIVPGLVMAAASFGHLPAVFLPAGPMASGLPNEEKARIRREYADGKLDRAALMQAEMASYHGPGTCTFYGTANSNQMLMEMMGLHMPGAAFVPPDGELRTALSRAGVQRALAITALGDSYTPLCDILDARAFVNGIVGLMATGGSTNLALHLPAMARAAGHEITAQDFADLSAITPLLARIYPNGLADVNHFHAAGGMAYVIAQLLDAGLVHADVSTVAGPGLSRYAAEPQLDKGALCYRPAPKDPENTAILRPHTAPFQPSGGLVHLAGNLGEALIKTSAIAPEAHIIEAPAAVFNSQEAVRAAFKAGQLNRDVIVVVRFQGPQANGMPELHGLTPALGVLQGRGFKVALVTDGRMSGASGKVPAAIHLSPEAAAGGPLARLQDGDLLRLDASQGRLEVLTPGALQRSPASPPPPGPDPLGAGLGLFEVFRRNVGHANTGASVILPHSPNE